MSEKKEMSDDLFVEALKGYLEFKSKPVVEPAKKVLDNAKVIVGVLVVSQALTLALLIRLTLKSC